MQTVNVLYMDKNGQFVGKKLYMEPHITVDRNGNNIYDTKEYFKKLSHENMGLVKGFFEQSSVSSMETNYIGSIGKDSNGEYCRSIDYKFLEKYKEDLKIEREEYEKIKKDENDKFINDLKHETNSGYQNMCDNMDRNMKQRLDNHNSLDNER